MTHLWVRSETRANEDRVAVTPEGVARLLKAGFAVTVEDDPTRVFPIGEYRESGAETAPSGAWKDADKDAIIVGLKELPDDFSPLRHRHIMFGHAYKGQPDGQRLLERFRTGGGTLLDLEYLTDDSGRRLAAFGYWAGFAGAAVSLKAWAAQMAGLRCGPVGVFATSDELIAAVRGEMPDHRPSALIIGALGRVGRGARDFCEALGVTVTGWDMAETASGGPFPEILAHDILLNCIFAAPGTPVFVAEDADATPRNLSVIGDIACDPTSDYSPIRVYDRVTTWDAPILRVHDDPPLDVMAIDNLPSMLPREASEDFAAQLLPVLLTLGDGNDPVWARAEALFSKHISR